jgi:hypothetical protein
MVYEGGCESLRAGVCVSSNVENCTFALFVLFMLIIYIVTIVHFVYVGQYLKILENILVSHLGFNFNLGKLRG